MTAAQRHWPSDLALCLVSLIWGATFVLVKNALADISTLLFLTIRFTIAAAALAVVVAVEHRGQQADPARTRAGIRAGIIAGAFLFGGYVLQTAGLRFTTPAKAGFITGLYIPLVPVFGAVAYRKLPKWSESVGTAIAVVGLLLLTFDRSIVAIKVGDLLVTACALLYAVHILLLGHFTKQVDTGVLAVSQIAMGAAIGACTFWWMEPLRVKWSPAVWLALAVTSLLATALAFWVQTWAQRYSSPTRTALILTLEPVFAWLTSFVLTGELLSTRALVGAVLILAGILVVELKPASVIREPA